MSRFETTFRNAIANAERDVLVEQIRANPRMSLSELGKLATGELGNLLKQITVADLVGAASGGPRAAAKAIERKPVHEGVTARSEGDDGRKARGEGGGRKPKVAQDEVDTRTGEGRAVYDQAVLAALRAATGPQSASNLTAVAGGSPLQIRTALARLIEAGQVHWSGRARGTRYTAA